MNLSISEQLAYSTVRIECECYDGSLRFGTGYFMRFKEDKTSHTNIPVVITNKHVINGAKKGRLIFSTTNQNGEPNDKDHFILIINNFQDQWIWHPDQYVDLCCMPILPFLNERAKSLGKTPFYIPLYMSLIPDQNQLANLMALEEIVMIGYPNGIWDTVNNKPIFRKGITATHPNYDYNGKKEFLIDAACFPGSSGSPVFILNELGYRDKRGNLTLGGSRILLLGTLYAGPQHTAEGEVKIVEVPTSHKSITLSKIPNNLGMVIKAERIYELESLFRDDNSEE